MAGFLLHRPELAAGASPFQPGSGKLPPYLAGRESEQGLIRGCLGGLVQRTAPASDIILYGPRGNGKTVLIEWARREAEALKIPVANLNGGYHPVRRAPRHRTVCQQPLARGTARLHLGPHRRPVGKPAPRSGLFHSGP